jgi:hypothetical protein
MKKIFLFLGAILISSATLLTSCTTDNSNPGALPPTIGFVAGPNFISNDATIITGTQFTIKVLAEANVTSATKLQSLKITRVFNLNSWDTTLTFNESTYTLEANFVAQTQAGVEKIEFKVTDKDGESATISLQITTEPETTPINTFAMKILGSYQSATGSSFGSADGNVYTLSQAFANQAAIDFLYWWGASTSATIGAPDDANAALVYTGVNGLPNWTTKNATRFKTSAITPAEFDAITDGKVLATNATGADQTHLGNLAVENVFSFVTVTGKHGMIKVTDINTGAAGDITIDVKIEL